MQGPLNSPYEVEKHRHKLTTCHWGLAQKKFVSSHLKNWNQNPCSLTVRYIVLFVCDTANSMDALLLSNAQFQMKLIEFGLSRIIFQSWGVVKSENESCSRTQFTLLCKIPLYAVQGPLNSPYEVEKHRHKLTTCHWGLAQKKFVSSHLKNWNQNPCSLTVRYIVLFVCDTANSMDALLLSNAQFQMKLIEFGLSRIIFQSWGVVKSENESCSRTQFTLLCKIPLYAVQGPLNSPYEVEKHRHKLTTCHWGLAQKKFVSSHLKNWNQNPCSLTVRYIVLFVCDTANSMDALLLSNAQFQMKLIEFGLSRIIFQS